MRNGAYRCWDHEGSYFSFYPISGYCTCALLHCIWCTIDFIGVAFSETPSVIFVFRVLCWESNFLVVFSNAYIWVLVVGDNAEYCNVYNIGAIFYTSMYMQGPNH